MPGKYVCIYVYAYVYVHTFLSNTLILSYATTQLTQSTFFNFQLNSLQECMINAGILPLLIGLIVDCPYDTLEMSRKAAKTFMNLTSNPDMAIMAIKVIYRYIICINYIYILYVYMYETKDIL